MKRDGILSVVVPAYNEEKNVARCAGVISSLLKADGIPYEIVFADDGSSDGTWQHIKAAHDSDAHVHGVSFDHNYGKDCAIWAGISHAAGDCIVTIDCDLQHPPEKIAEMYHMWQGGADCIEGCKNTRGEESAAKGLCVKLFYALLSFFAHCDMTCASDFKLIDRAVADKITSRKTDFYRAAPACEGIVGKKVFFDVAPREQGSSKWSLWKLIKYMFFAIASVSHAPLYIALTMMAASASGGALLIMHGHIAPGIVLAVICMLAAVSTMPYMKKKKQYIIEKTI